MAAWLLVAVPGIPLGLAWYYIKQRYRARNRRERARR